MEIGRKALQLILSYEGMDQPNIFPGGASGITIGRGYDLGYEKTFKEDWQNKLSSEDYKRLSATLGLNGASAAKVAKNLKGIIIKKSDADEVFNEHTLPKYISWTIQAFPNSDKLHPDAFGALVSIIFNRGPLINNTDKRKEMLQIKQILQANPNPDAKVVKQIAQYVRNMARLWPDNKNSDGDLHDRRLAEASLIEKTV